MLRCLEFTATSAPDATVKHRSHEEVYLAVRLERRLQCQILRPIRVHICENELQLFGQVTSWYEKQQAQETAREIAPMYRIRNELRVSQITAGS
jgi:hypothetical protein